MNELEFDWQLAAWSAQAEQHAPRVPIPVFPDTPRWHESMLVRGTAVAAAAAAVAVIGIVSVRTPHGDSVAQSIAAGVVSAVRPVSFHGLTVDVPTNWSTNGTKCGKPIEDTVILGGGPSAACLITQPVDVSSVTFSPDRSGVWTAPDPGVEANLDLNGIAAERTDAAPGGDNASWYSARIDVKSLSVTMIVQAPTEDVVNRIVDSARIVDVNSDGCATRIAVPDTPGKLPSGEPPARPGADSELLPEGVTGITVCRYYAGLMEQSYTLPSIQQQAFTTVLRSTPVGSSVAPSTDVDCADSAVIPYMVDDESYRVLALYPDGKNLALTARAGWCADLGISNGTTIHQMSPRLVQELATVAGNTAGFPANFIPK